MLNGRNLWNFSAQMALMISPGVTKFWGEFIGCQNGSHDIFGKYKQDEKDIRKTSVNMHRIGGCDRAGPALASCFGKS
jgi:hypothetical protein